MKNGIGKRIDECLEKLKVSDGENAFIQLCLAIEGTSKLAYPHIKSSAIRNKQFIRDSMPFVFWCLTNGTPATSKNFLFEMGDGKEFSLEDVMYKLLRCSLVHEAEMSDLVAFTECNYIKNEGEKIILPLAMLGAYCWAVIANPVNKTAHLDKNYKFFRYGTVASYDLNDCWGDEKALREIIRKGFLYDVEKILQKMNKKSTI